MQLSHPVGVLFFIFSLVLGLCYRQIFDAMMKIQLRLTPTSIMHNIWIKNDVPIHLEIHLFNFTNVEEFKCNKSVIPNFDEIGPFLFQESREKVAVFWDNLYETVTFNQTKKWKLLPASSQDLSTKITNINPVATTIAYISRLWESKLQREIANALLKTHEPLTVTASAQEWLFDGIPDKFLEIIEGLRKVTDIPIPYNKFGWFYERNTSSSFDGVFTINTGKSCESDLGMMVTWNKKNKTTHYKGECARVYGTTGEIIPPLKHFQKSISVFASDICSYVTLKYSGTSEVKGIRCYEYVGDESVFDNGTLYPENACFCLGDSCPSGSRNVSSCRFGSPAFISFPHFYLADSVYTKNLSGMNPDEKKHKFTLKVEPTTGIPLAVNGSFQINFLVGPFDWCDEFRDFPKLYIPMLWFRQNVEISSEYSQILKVALFFRSRGGCIIIGTAFFIFLFSCTYCLIHK